MSPRLDAALAERGLARSRTHAATLIAEGLVSVDGRVVVKASTPVGDDAALVVAGADHYVSRAAHKLVAGLDAFAVDVGHGQLAASILADPGVISVEGFNVRYMTRESLAAATGVAALPSIVTGDLSFISLELVFPAVVEVCGEGADVVLLIKPQFEVGRTAVKGGLVTDPTLRVDAVERVLWSAWDAGLGTLGIVSSPIAGTHGNSEYVAHLAPGRGSNPTEWLGTVNRLAGAR
jgi:23S rRNA (cytidine1920-2'-O)/16S rRNA (cytidine1409-2'-O)-methyltransferase